MTDEVDLSTEREEYMLNSQILRSRKPEGPVANGRCHWCDEILPDTHRFCDAICRDNFERYGGS